MRKLISLVLSLSLVLGSVPMFAGAAAAAEATTETPFNITIDAGIQQQLQNFTDIKAMFAEQPVVLADIQAKYIADFQAHVKVLDEAIASDNPKINESIISTLDYAIAGHLSVNQAKQAVDKGLQWYFYFLMKDYVNGKAKPAIEAGDQATAKVELEKAVQIYAGALQATAGKRDAKFGTTTQDLLDTVVVPALITDIENKDALSFNLHRQMLDKTLIKVFVLATMTYAETAPTKPVEEQPAAVTEGYFFYMSIYSYLKGGSAKDADYIKDAFGSGDAAKIDYHQIKAAFIRTLIGKISEYAEKTLQQMEAGNLESAQVYAMEGNMFLAAGETFLVEKFGKTAYSLAVLQGTTFAQNVAKGELAVARDLAFSAMQFITQLDGIRFKVNSNKIFINGVEKVIDQIGTLSYINPTTSRTLVSAKFISESVGANVTWLPETRTVIIEKDGKKIEMQLGSDVVKLNGEVVAERTLDQPVVIKDSRSYVPLRALVELLGYKVFYRSGDIVIVK